MPTNTIEVGSHMDTIDVRDIVDRIKQLRKLIKDAKSSEEKNELRVELQPLKKLADELAEHLGVNHTGLYNSGLGLIKSSYFVDYVRETAFDLGDIKRDSDLVNYVDWDTYAQSAENDYSEFWFDGEPYLIRD